MIQNYQIQTRPHNIGGGWRNFRVVRAGSVSEACDIASKMTTGFEPSTSPFNSGKDGTPEKPFITWFGISEMCAVKL